VRVAVWVVPFVLDLVLRNEDEFPIFAPTRVDFVVFKPHDRWVAVGLVAAALLWIVRHVPRAVKLLVQWYILRRMLMCPRLCDGQAGPGKHPYKHYKARLSHAVLLPAHRAKTEILKF